MVFPAIVLALSVAGIVSQIVRQFSPAIKGRIQCLCWRHLPGASDTQAVILGHFKN